MIFIRRQLSVFKCSACDAKTSLSGVAKGMINKSQVNLDARLLKHKYVSAAGGARRPGLTLFKRATNASNRLQLRARASFTLYIIRSNNIKYWYYLLCSPTILCIGRNFNTGRRSLFVSAKTDNPGGAKSGSPLIRERSFLKSDSLFAHCLRRASTVISNSKVDWHRQLFVAELMQGGSEIEPNDSQSWVSTPGVQPAARFAQDHGPSLVFISVASSRAAGWVTLIGPPEQNNCEKSATAIFSLLAAEHRLVICNFRPMKQWSTVARCWQILPSLQISTCHQKLAHAT